MKIYPDLSREERIAKIMDQRRNDLVLVLENLTEELNVSAIIRTAEGFGVGQVCVIHAEGKQPKLSRNTSSGAAKWMKVEFFTSTAQCLEDLKKKGYKLVGALVDPQAKPIWEANLEGKVAIVMGSEAPGLTKETTSLVDENIYIPMYGLTESFNVSVATSIFLYETIRQKESDR